MTDTRAVRPEDALDEPALEAWLRGSAQLPALPEQPMVVEQFTGGHANLTYRVSFGNMRLVVRRPPRGHLATGAHDMAREHRVLSRLNGSYARAPRALDFCDDPAVIGAPFVVIEYRKGVVIRDRIPPALAGHADVVRRANLALIDAAADLHTVDIDAAGLGELGRPEGFGRRQVEGWRERWRRAAGDTRGEPGGTYDVMETVAERLLEQLPHCPAPAIVHNDLKLDNCQFQPDDPDVVTSIFDWDMATLGDPLFDLGNLLVSMQTSPVWELPRDEAVERYASRAQRDVTEIDWYLGFATWRTATVLQQLRNRFAAGDSADEQAARFAAAIPQYATRAQELISGSARQADLAKPERRP